MPFDRELDIISKAIRERNFQSLEKGLGEYQAVNGVGKTQFLLHGLINEAVENGRTNIALFLLEKVEDKTNILRSDAQEAMITCQNMDIFRVVYPHTKRFYFLSSSSTPAFCAQFLSLQSRYQHEQQMAAIAELKAEITALAKAAAPKPEISRPLDIHKNM